jgi:hypothetical protein
MARRKRPTRIAAKNQTNDSIYLFTLSPLSSHRFRIHNFFDSLDLREKIPLAASSANIKQVASVNR